MIFWDASALVPLFILQPNSDKLERALRQRSPVGIWWGSVVECWSAFARLRREGILRPDEEAQARERLKEFQRRSDEIAPSEEIRRLSGTLLLRHPLRAADSLQLAAALIYSGTPASGDFFSLDVRLKEAARLEGLSPLP
ncbi:MAG: type II toxin-antitoxin system VapC family toxin [Gemmatimonadota bacterium]